MISEKGDIADMNAQQRLLIIFMRLLRGKKINKFELMEKFDIKESTVQRDIVKIEEMLADEVHEMHRTKKLRVHRDGKGNYQIVTDENKEINSGFTDTEVLLLLKIVLSTRILPKEEMTQLIEKLVSLGEQPDNLYNQSKNELFHYQGISDASLIDKLELIEKAIAHRQKIQFEYTKNGETRVFERVPHNVFFADLYLFMICSSENSQDDRDFESLNKFRINNMKELKVVSANHKMPYKDRFEGGVLRKQTATFPFFGKPIQMVIDFYYDPVYVLDRFPDSRICHQNKDGSFRIEMKVNDGYGTKMWLTSQSHMVKVISPKQMRDYVIEEMKNTLKFYNINI